MDTRSKSNDSSLIQELQLRLERSQSQIDHLRAHTDVLALTLEDAKAVNDDLAASLAKREANATAHGLAAAYSDRAVEAYDVLVALMETEVELATQGDDEGSGRAAANRRSAERVARHILGRDEEAND